MVTGFLGGVASGTIILLAVTTGTSEAHTTTVAAMSEAASTSFNTTDDDGVTVCPTKVAACFDDTTCLNCNSELSTSSTDFRECGANIGLDDVESSTATCSDYIASMYCVEETSELECLENDVFVVYWACALEYVGCGDKDVACDCGGDASDGSVDTAESASNGACVTSCAGYAMAALAVLSSAFVLFL